MSYNWEKIFKDKADKELYKIFLGKQQLSAEAIDYAEKELKSRNFNFDNIDSLKKKWTLEKLIEEERNESGAYSFFKWSSNSKHHLMTAIFGTVVFLLMTLDYFFDFITKTNKSKDPYEQIGFIVFFLAFSIFGLVSYFKKKNQENKRKMKIKELINEMN